MLSQQLIDKIDDAKFFRPAPWPPRSNLSTPRARPRNDFEIANSARPLKRTRCKTSRRPLPTVKRLREELDAEAPRQNCRDRKELLVAQLNPLLRKAWQPKIPLNEVSDDCRRKAVKLQRALLPSLERYERGEMAGAELEQLGRADYAREFGHEIADRTWRFVFQRTRARARNADDFLNVALFLDDNCARKREMPKALSFDESFGPLHRLITGFSDPTAPTSTEGEALWFAACKLFLAHAGTSGERKLKRALLDFLWQFAPSLATSAEALRVNSGRKFDRFGEKQAHPLALKDGRESKRGEDRAPAFSQADLDQILTHSLFNCGARLAQGVRELRELGEQSGLSREMRKYLGHEFNGTAPQSKSYVPHRLREALRHDLEVLKPYRIGARAADAASAWVKRDWSGVPSMYAPTMDDVTMPIYAWHHDKTGKCILTRGQCILAVDCRSLKVLGFSLQPDRNYNAAVIRSLITTVCSESFVYHDKQTGRLIGQDVLAWFDPETPEHIVLTDMNRKNPILVERSAAVPALDTDSEVFQHELRRHTRTAATRRRAFAW